MARKREYLKRITIENRIILLLYDHRKRKDDYSVPEVLSQGGMSKELDIRQNNISRSLQELGTKGYVVSRSAHVTGKQRRRKVYFLTEKGTVEAEGIISGLMKRYVLVRTKKGDLEEWKLDRFISHLSRQMSRSFSLYETITRHLDGNEADLTLSVPADIPRPRISSIPVPVEFYGRKEELSLLQSFREMKGPAMMLVIGIAGQGKTTLLSHFLTHDHITRFHWVPCNRWMRPLNFLIGCASSLRPYSASNLSDHLKSTGTPDPRIGVTELIRDMSQTGMLLILDDAHRMNEEMSDFMKLLKENLFTSDMGTKLVMMSRERPHFYTRAEVLIDERMMELELEGLDRVTVSDLLKDVNIPKEEHDMIYQLTNGHPLALSLLKASPELDPADLRSSLDRFLDEEVLSSISREERSILELASILEDPVRMDCFTSLKGVGAGHVTSLRNRMLLREYGDGGMDLHDAIKDTVGSSLSPERIQELQKVALKYYSKRSRDTDLLNYLRLCRELGKMDEAVSILTEYGEYLLGRGFPLVLESLGDLLEKDLERSTRVRMLLLISEAERLSMNADGSKRSLREAALLCEDLYQSDESEGMVLMSRILGRMAELHLLEGVSKEGMETYRSSLKLVKKAGIPREEGKVLSNMGTAYMGIGEFDLAIDHLGRALDIYRGLDDHRGANICRLNMGEVYQLRGDLSQALKEYLETIRDSSGEGLDRIHYQALYRTGKLYMMVMQPGEALGYLRSALSGYQSVIDLEYAEMVLVQFVSSCIKSDETDDCIRTLKRTRRVILRGDRFGSFFGGRRRTSGKERYIGWINVLIGLMDGGGRGTIKELIGMLEELGPDSDLEMLREIAYCMSRDFEGPDRDFLMKMKRSMVAAPRFRVELSIMAASLQEKGSEGWKEELREALRISRKEEEKDQVRRIRLILGSVNRA